MSTRNPTDWMWAQACEMIEQAERMHRQFFRLATSSQASTVWEPPVDVLEDERGVVVIVALPGVPADAIEVAHEAGDFVVRAVRRLPSPGARGAVHQIEIPHGHFERRIRVPGIRVEESTREMRDGCLILRLSKAPRGGGR
jgi:HSP20 family molecular chaperone IbpA